jgi:hypothetical protein
MVDCRRSRYPRCSRVGRLGSVCARGRLHRHCDPVVGAWVSPITGHIYASSSPPAQPPAQPDTPEPEERTFVDVTSRYLVGLFEGLTNVQAAPLTKPFIGKWIRVSGPLGNVSGTRLDTLQVTFQFQSTFLADRDYFTVYMYFDRERWEERLAVIPPGTTVSVVGRLREFDSILIHLDDCELADDVRPQEQEEQPAPD